MQDVANRISSGSVELGVAIGAESITNTSPRLTRPFVRDILDANKDAVNCINPMRQRSLSGRSST